METTTATTSESRITIAAPTAPRDVTVWCESTEDPNVWWLRTEPLIYPPPQPLTAVPMDVTAEDLVELAQRGVEHRQGATCAPVRVTVVQLRGHLALEAHDGREGTAWTVQILPDTEEPWTLTHADEPRIEPLTRRDHEGQLADGTDPLVREIHLARTAGGRHESRVRATKLALAREVLGHDVPGSQRELAARWVRETCDVGLADPIEAMTPAQRGVAAALAAMDAHGIGGPGGLGGPQGGTARMSWATGLGTGRRQASDGPAWISALTAIGLDQPRPEDVERCALGDADAAFALAYSMHRAYEWRSDVTEASRWCAAARVIAAQIDVADSLGGRLAQRYGLEIRRPEATPAKPPAPASASAADAYADLAALLAGLAESSLLGGLGGNPADQLRQVAAAVRAMSPRRPNDDGESEVTIEPALGWEDRAVDRARDAGLFER